MTPTVVLTDRAKKWLCVYGRVEQARTALRVLGDLAGPGAVVRMTQMRIDFSEGGWAKFVSVNDSNDLYRLQGLEIDDYWCEETLAQRLAPIPLLAFLATRRRSK